MSSTRSSPRYTPLAAVVTTSPTTAKEEAHGSDYIEMHRLDDMPTNAKHHRDEGSRAPQTFFKRLQTSVVARLERGGFHGWRMGVLIGSCLSAFVLCCNIALVIVGSKANGGYQRGIAKIGIGTSRDTATWSTISHLLINACSTILLAASNYTMQVLSAPTRGDIDRAHGQGQWYDIGLLSFRNARSLPQKRTAMWLVLAFSSVPLHLLSVSTPVVRTVLTHPATMQRFFESLP